MQVDLPIKRRGAYQWQNDLYLEDITDKEQEISMTRRVFEYDLPVFLLLACP